MQSQSRRLLDAGEVSSSTVLSVEPESLARLDRETEETRRQSLLAAVTETLCEWDRSLDQHLPEEEQVAALRSHQAARRDAEAAGCSDSDIQAASGDVVNLPSIDTAGDERDAALLDEVEASLRYWENVRFLGLDAEHKRKAMRWHLASVEAARTGGYTGPEIGIAVLRAGEPLEIQLSPSNTEDALADLRTLSDEIDKLLEASPDITETDTEWIALDNRVRAAQEYALNIGCDQHLVLAALTTGEAGNE